MKKNFKNPKIVILLLIVAAVAVIGGIGGTLAAFQDKTNEVKNQFIVGNVTTEIVEIFNRVNDKEYNKNPRVTNTGMNDCYIRMRYQVTPEEMKDQITFVGLENNGWDKKGGWYYYPKVVAPGDSTSELFTGLIVDYNETDKPWMDFDIILYQEAVQTKVIDDKGQEITDPITIWNEYKNE